MNPLATPLFDPNRQYEISNVNSGKLLDVAGGSTAPGGGVIQYHDGNTANQRWRLTPTGDGYFTIYNVNSSLVLSMWAEDPRAMASSSR